MALIAMTWRSEPADVTLPQAGAFGGAALWLGADIFGRSGQDGQPCLPVLLHVVSAIAIIWMLTAMTGIGGMTGMPCGGAGGRTMMPMARAMSAPLLVVSVLLAVTCAVGCVPWLARAIGPGLRVRDPVSVSSGAMSAGMAAMMLATL